MPLSRLNDGFEIELEGIAFGMADKSIIGTPPPNRYALIRYDGGAEAFDKVWNGGLKEWVEKEGSKYADFRLFNVEAAEMK